MHIYSPYKSVGAFLLTFFQQKFVWFKIFAIFDRIIYKIGNIAANPNKFSHMQQLTGASTTAQDVVDVVSGNKPVLTQNELTISWRTGLIVVAVVALSAIALKMVYKK